MGTSNTIRGRNASGSKGTGKLPPHDLGLRYKTLFDQSPYGVVLTDLQGKILDFNEKAYGDLGYTKEEFANLSIADMDPLESAAEIQARINGIFESGGAEFEVKHRTKQGEIRDVLVIAKPLTLSGQPVVHSIWRDITERKKTEGAMRLQSEIARNIAEGVYLVSVKDLKIVYANPKMEEMFGYDRGEMNGKHVSLINAPTGGDPVQTAKQIEQALRESGRWSGEVHNIRKDGTTFWGNASISMFHHPEYGDVYVSLQTDITARKQAEEALQLSEERFRLAMLGATDGLWDWNLQTDEVYYSPRWKSMLGYGIGDLEDHLDTWKRLVHPEDKEPTLAVVSDLLEGRTDRYEVEFRMRHKDGHYLNILSRAFLAHDTTGTPVRLVGTHVDITERKRMEEALRKSEEFIRNIIDNVDEGFLVVDRDYRILAANRAYCAWRNAAGAAIVGRHCFEVSHGVARPCYEEGEECAVKSVFESGQPHTAMHKHEDADGNIMFVETKAFPLKDSSGAVTSAIETIHDITERHLLEEEQLKTQKLEAIGTLAGGIAHDFNNLLQGVFGYMTLARISLDKKDVALTMLQQAEEALNMSISLAKQLLTFSRGGKPVMKLIDVRTVIGRSAKFALSGSRSFCNIDVDRNLWAVQADEGQIAQVIQNIALNANEAMPEGGVVEVLAQNVEFCPGGSALLPAGGRFVKISIKDTGIGIPENFIKKIFDPYFTTKQKGSGLGLATSYSIMRNHGGTIEVTSEVNRGTVFSIYLPAIDDRREEIAPPRPPVTARKGKILVLDDEETVRSVSEIMLAFLGHEVAFAENAEEAVKKFEEAENSGRPFDIAILDLTIKGSIGGEKVAAKLHEIAPAAKLVVSSGYSDNAIVSNCAAYGFAASLNKPYTIEALGECLNNLLKQSV